MYNTFRLVNFYLIIITPMFQYTVDVDSDEPIMLINKHIGFDDIDGYGIDGSSFQSELLALDTMGKKRIQVWINSAGGSVIEGMSIYNAILKSKTKVDTYNVGICASIAGVIFQAGRNRIMADYSLLMYHNPYNSNGKKDEGLDKIKMSLTSMISARCGKDESEISAMMDKTTWIHAEDALNSGMCDSIEKSNDFNKKRLSPESADIRAFWNERNLVLNNLFNNNKIEKMVKVANKLGLNPDVNEDTILNAVTEIQNKLDVSETKNKANEDKILELEIAEENKSKELDALRTELAELKNKANEIEETAKTEKAENLVKEAVNAGKIKEESKSNWINKAKEDFEGVKAMIDELPLNKVAPKITENEEVIKPYNMASLMQEIKIKSNK